MELKDYVEGIMKILVNHKAVHFQNIKGQYSSQLKETYYFFTFSGKSNDIQIVALVRRY